MATKNNKNETWTFDMLMQSFKELRESQAETTMQIKELQAEVRRVNSVVNGVAASNGKVAEDTIFNVFEQDKTFAGIEFEAVHRNLQGNTDFETSTEFDIILEKNSGKNIIAIIETKYRVKEKDVMELEKKLKAFRVLFPKYSDYTIILGIGGMGFNKDALELAKKKGIGVIKVIGDKVEYHTKGIKKYRK
jgi:hypothetical protein